MPSESLRVAGLMSGTSLDGTDALVAEVVGDDPAVVRFRILAFDTVPHPPELRARLREAVDRGTARTLTRLHRDLGLAFGRALANLLADHGIAPRTVAAAGSHGQTVWHDPPGEGRTGATLQLGCPATLAEVTGIPVVHDFRARDVAAGGHGAPLVPWADWILFRQKGRGRALQNLGGMGNVTFLPGGGDAAAGGGNPVHGGPHGVRAFDTGPGVALLDGAARRASRGEESWDVDGRRAARGTVRQGLLDELLADPFFGETPPRSTGRERFGEALLDRIVAAESPRTREDWDDLLATLTELTARSVARSYRDFLPAGALHEVVLTGGGARNPTLVQALERALDPLPVRTGARALGMDPDAREAAAFALLAWAHLKGVPGNLPQVTGASGHRVLGSLTPGRDAAPGADPGPEGLR